MDPSLPFVIQFLIVAACVFALVKAINKLKREEARNRNRRKPNPCWKKSGIF